VTRWALDTVRMRVVGGLAVLIAGLALTAMVGVTALRTMRGSVREEMLGLRATTEVTNGLVVTVFDEIRAAEQYLSAPSAEARAQFTGASDAAFAYLRRLETLEALTVDDRLAVNRLKQLHAVIQVEYAMAHALLDHFERMRTPRAHALSIGDEQSPLQLEPAQRDLLMRLAAGYRLDQVAAACRVSAAELGRRLRAIVRKLQWDVRAGSLTLQLA